MTTSTAEGARWAEHTVPGDHITLTGLRAFAHHGVFQHEKDDGQEFFVDVTVWLDVHAAASGDELAATVNYGTLAEQVVASIEHDPVDLIETVAERVAGVALGFEAVRRTRVTLHKPHAPITVPFADVAVTLERERPAAASSMAGASHSAATVDTAVGPARPGGRWHPVVLALGANLGDREATLLAAVRDLAATPGLAITAVSGLYATPALTTHGIDRSAPAYLNAVVRAVTELHPRALLEVTSTIEDAHGRVRAERWGARTLDVDIVDYDGRSSEDPVLTLPHPRAADRAFVLVPWLETDPDAILAGHGPVAFLVRHLEDEATLRADSRWADTAWPGPPERAGRHETQ